MAGLVRRATKFRYLILAGLSLVLLIGVALSQDEELEPIENITESRFAFNFDQVVRGVGFHNINQDLELLTGEPRNKNNGLYFKNLGHGSGSYDYEESLIANKGARFTQTGLESIASGNFGIEFNESEDHVFSSTYFYSGKKFKFDGFQSKGSSETSVKNYLRTDGSGVSMDATFDNAEVMSKDVSSSLYHVFETRGATEENRTQIFIGVARLELEAAFTGSMHLGAQAVRDDTNYIFGSALKAQGNRTVHTTLFDEDYSGTYSITSKLYYDFLSGTGIEEEEAWLPCCFGGWDSLPSIYRLKIGKDTKGIFDCTCYKPLN